MSLLREGTHVSVTRLTSSYVSVLCYETHTCVPVSHRVMWVSSCYETHIEMTRLTSRLISMWDDSHRDSHRDVRHRNMTRLTSRCERWRDSHRDVRHTSSYVSVTSRHTHTQDVETWGTGVETQKNTKNLVPLFEKDKNKNSHQRRRLLQHYWYKVPVLHIVKTIWGASRNGNLLVQIEPKNGFESEKVIMGIDS